MVSKMHVVLIDDHPLFRAGVAQALNGEPDIAILAEGASAQDAVQLASDLAPDILVLDVDVPGGGLSAAREVAERCPATRTVMLAASGAENVVLAALRAGARAYVLNRVSGRELVGILRGVWAGEAYVTPGLAASLLTNITVARSARQESGDAASTFLLEDLSDREQQVLELVASGLSNKEIGQELRLTEKTIKHHMTTIMHKLRVHNRVQAALLLQHRDDRQS